MDNHEFYIIEEGFRFNGSHTSEFGLRLIERTANPPSEKEVKENIPYMQGELDFSDILGVRVFNNRTLSYTFELIDYNYETRKIDETFLSNWLMRTGKQQLFDDYDRGYYYLSKCTSVESIDNYYGTNYRITFDAYPFMIGEQYEGNDIWDTFNFLLDVAQITKFNVNGSATVTLYNAGMNTVIPTIKASSPFTIRKDNVTYNIPQGESESHEFYLALGENKLIIEGTGTIEFLFRKELI